MTELFIEAESFAQKGGWVIDTASMEVIGSAYLMAHGMGEPVQDAVTEFVLPQTGEYTFWALTRDWTACWNVEKPAGIFRLAVDGTALETALGTNGKDWAWQCAGTARLAAGTHILALQDCTGFNGRCDAVYITDGKQIPDNTAVGVASLRCRLGWKEVRLWEKTYDLIVTGGGVAGICTALAASRSGIRVALIHDRAVLGGCNSSEVRVCMGGQIKLPPYENLGNVVREIAPVMGHPSIYKKEYFEDHRKHAVFEVPEARTGSCDLLLNKAVTAVEKEGSRITAVICTDTVTGEKTKLCAGLFADCSGDGILARLGGAQLMYGNEAAEEFGESLAPEQPKKLVMGHSIRWYSEEKATPCFFPELDWGLHFDRETYLNCRSGDWEQETGFTRDMVAEAEYIRDYGLRAIYANWSYQKNHCGDAFANAKLVWVSPVGGKRESWRVRGDYVLSQRDLEERIPHTDGTAAITWGIDIHYPEPLNARAFGEAFRSFAYHRSMPAPCPVPYRCLYAKDVENLFIGGRLVSTTHVAFSAVRVMRTLGMLGEVAGLAAAVCVRHGCTPRAVYQQHLEELKDRMKQGVPVPSAFACGGIGEQESYHFKDIGWWRLHDGVCTENGHQPRRPLPEEIKKFFYCVKALGIRHKYPLPEKWDE